jgi:SAM-dependent methyltransferase
LTLIYCVVHNSAVKRECLKYLACPSCAGDLAVTKLEKFEKDSIESGVLQCLNCQATFDIVGHIPRFVAMENYASGFGFEWYKHARTQYDSYTGTNISETRFFQETRWPRQLPGEIILEVGSGSGRFTEHAASTGAMVVSLDYSYAVEANYMANGQRDNVLVVQGDIYSMPFRANFFDRLFCIGVLQHTPDVERAFLSLPQYLKPGGSLVIDVYRHSWGRYLANTRYWARLITRHLAPETLYKLCEQYVNLMWPLARWVNKLPKGRHINWNLLIADYRGAYPLSEQVLKEWAILDTFDILAAVYENPQSLSTVRAWFAKAGLENVEVGYGYNGIEGRGTKPI